MYTRKAPGPLTARQGPRGVMQDFRRTEKDSITAPAPQRSSTAVSIDLLDTLEQAWRMIGRAYDVTAALPDMPSLFEGTDTAVPDRAAETVVANMLLHVMEHIGRFSAAYQRPMGLIRIQGSATQRACWRLSPETRARWKEQLTLLSVAIKRNTGLLLAAELIDDLTQLGEPDESQVLAHCLCAPPHVIIVNRTALECGSIICDTCRQPFRPVEASDTDPGD